MSIEKYIGRTVEMIYQDQSKRITYRTIRVRAVHEGKVYAYDFTKRAPRVFDMDNILADRLVSHDAS